MSQCDKSLSTGFIPINTWQQRASLPFKSIQGHRLQIKMASLLFLLKNDKTFSITIKYIPLSYRIGGNRKRSEKIAKSGSQIATNSDFDRQSVNKWQSKTVSNDL